MFHFFYHPNTYLKNDFIGPVGTYDFHFLSAAPRVRANYLSIVKPFDTGVWICTWIFTLGVTVALVIINRCYESWYPDTPKESIVESMVKKKMSFFMNSNVYFSSAILFSLGAIFDEAQGHHDDNNYIIQNDCSKARKFLVFWWLLIGYMLTTSYGSVLRSQLMKIHYEEKIDYIDDMLGRTGMRVMVAVDTAIPQLLQSDPRENVIELNQKMVDFYNFTDQGRIPDWVEKG